MPINEPESLISYSLKVSRYQNQFLLLDNNMMEKMNTYYNQYINNLIENGRENIDEQSSKTQIMVTAGISAFGKKKYVEFFANEHDFSFNINKYNIDVDLHGDTNDIFNEIDKQVAAIKKSIIERKRNLQIRHGKLSLLNDFIRTKDGKKVKNPFEYWERILITYQEWEKIGKPSRIPMTLVIDLKSRDGKINEKSAYNRVQEEIKDAIIFTRRAVNGTFPYNENGEWMITKADRQAVSL